MSEVQGGMGKEVKGWTLGPPPVHLTPSHLESPVPDPPRGHCQLCSQRSFSTHCSQALRALPEPNSHLEKPVPCGPTCKGGGYPDAGASASHCPSVHCSLLWGFRAWVLKRLSRRPDAGSLEWGREKLWLFLGHRSSLREDRGSLPQDPQPEVPVLRG